MPKSMTRRSLPGLLASLLGLLAACSAGAPEAAPTAVTPAEPALCKPPAPLPSSGHFVDVTAEVGLGEVLGGRVTSVDLDGDGLPDLVLHGFGVKREGLVKVYMNRGGKFADATGASGLLDSREASGSGRLAHLTVLGDVDNDGDLDAFEGTYLDGKEEPAARNDRSEIRLNDGKGHFTFAERSDVQGARYPTTAAAFVDVDRDGLLDVFVGTFYASGVQGGGNRLYAGFGDGFFADVSRERGVLRDSLSAGSEDERKAFLAGMTRRAAYGVSACDIDDDGDMDLMVSAYGRQYNELWRNENGKFTETGRDTPFASDGSVDYRDNEFYRCYCQANPGKCPAEVKSPRVSCQNFSWTPDFDDQPARNGGNTFSTVCADIDDDGDMDALHAEIKHWHIGESSDATQLLRNDGKGAFSRVPNEQSGLARKHVISDWNEGDITAGFFDYDNDGKKDIFIGSSDYPETWGLLFHQEPGGTFRELARDVGLSHYHAVGFTAVDIDGDGDLDLVVATSVARCSGDKLCPEKPVIKVYRNQVGHTRNSVKIKLRGGGAGRSNGAGIGARVSVTAAGKTQVQEVSGGYGHFGLQLDTVLTFGLGDACAIDKVTVRWPDARGTVQTWTKIRPNTLSELTEGSDEVKVQPFRK